MTGNSRRRPASLGYFALFFQPRLGSRFILAHVASRGDDGVAALEFSGLDRTDRRRLTLFVTEELRKRLDIVRSLQEERDDDWD